MAEEDLAQITLSPAQQVAVRVMAVLAVERLLQVTLRVVEQRFTVERKGTTGHLPRKAEAGEALGD